MFLADPKSALAVASGRRFCAESTKLIGKPNPCVKKPSACVLLFYQRAAGNSAADALEVPFRGFAQNGCLSDLGEHGEVGVAKHSCPSDTA